MRVALIGCAFVLGLGVHVVDAEVALADTFVLASVTQSAATQRLPVTDAIFVEPFGKLLKRNPILLTTGGARYLELEDGAIAVICVGSVRADNDDREEVAEIRALGALAQLKNGEIRTEEKNRRVVSTECSIDDGKKRDKACIKEELDSRKEVNSYALLPEDMETVGTWLSRDGKKFFLAKGRIVRPKKGK